jgi:3-phenylpropionate/trans-cinnamate dioxygenase ferredoxin reductase subunit
MTTESTIVIIGAGQAGGWAAATLRQEGFGGRVILLGAEQHRPYERPPLSKAVLKGEVPPDSCHLHSESDFAAQQIDFRPGTVVDRIDLEARQVHPAGGEPIGYDRLILCTGGRARTLDLPGRDLPGVLTLRTFEDAAALGDHFRRAEPVVVIGGGWIGLEAAAVAREFGCPVTVLEAQERLCQRTVPPVLSDYLLGLHRRHGVDVRLGAAVTAIREAGERLCVRLADGTELPAGTVVVGVGLIPNDELAQQAGIVCERGVVVNTRCQTSDPQVFAAGDVAVTPNPWSAVPLRLESWQNAQEQGMAAARAALGRDITYAILPWFWSDQYDIRLQIHGVPRLHADMVIRGDSHSDDFSVLFVHGDQLIAAMGPGAARDLRTCKRIIERGITVDPAALADSARSLPKK